MVGRWPIVLVALLLTGTASAAMPGRDEVEMVPVPAGEFVMGSDDEEADDDERPMARVVYRSYPYDAGDGREDLEARGARVNRGGSWYYGARYGRATYRATADHVYRRIGDLGFRCAASSAPGATR
jgi:formylglycine-generating enzyme required for sulfatase activity